MITPSKTSEQALISFILSEDRKAKDLIFSQICRNEFHSEGQGEIYGILVERFNDNLPTDFGSVEDEIKHCRKDYLLDPLLDCSLRSDKNLFYSVESFISQVKATHKSIALSRLCHETLKKFQEGCDHSEILTSHLSKALSLEGSVGQGTTFTMEEVGTQLESLLDMVKENPDALLGIHTGFSGLDDITGGFRPGELIVVAARPGIGKSIFGAQVVTGSPYDPSGVVTLEMSSVEFFSRMVAKTSGRPLQSIRTGKFTSKYDEDAVRSSIRSLKKSNIFFEDCPNASIMEIRSKIRQLHSKFGIKIAIVDYLQLVSGTDRNRAREMGEVSQGLKSIAKELNIPVVALAQLNREAAEEEPSLHHLKDSGDIEANADIVILLHRKDVTEQNKKDQIFTTLIKVAKQRNGPTRGIMTQLHGNQCKFVEL